MDASLLSIGTELTDGALTDTNAPWLAQRLRELGVRVRRVEVLPDEVEAIAEAIRRATARAEVVIATGGLGPTADDCTHEAAARALHLEYVFDEAQSRETHQRLQRERGRAMELVDSQFFVPRGGLALSNPTGIALGFVVRLASSSQGGSLQPRSWHDEPLADSGEGLFAVLPGVPHEMRAMYEAQLEPRLRRVLASLEPLQSRAVHIAAAEKRVQDMLSDVLAPTTNGGEFSASITLDEQAGFVVVRFTSRDAVMLERVVQTVHERLGVDVFGEGEETVAAALLARLRAHGYTLGLAESCTGGLASSLLARIPGVSDTLMESVVSYSNAAKTARLGVARELLEAHGAVSEPVARAMAEGMRASAGVDVAVAITGIAGPGGGSAEKPVGLVHIGLATPAGSSTKARVFAGDRGAVQLRAAQYALDQARRTVL